MSYDLRLYRKNKEHRPLTQEEIERLKGTFDVHVLNLDDVGHVIEFTAKYKGSTFEEDEFYYQKDGSYWTYVSYGATNEEFDHFLKTLIGNFGFHYF